MRKLILVVIFSIMFGLHSSTIETKENYNLNNIEYYELISRINKSSASNIEHQKVASNNLPIISPLNITDIIRISDVFGYRSNHPVLNIESHHTGIDFATYINNDVRSTAYGKVKKISYDYLGYGKYIVIDHLNKYETIYAHLYKSFVKSGDFVKKGDIIGKSGNSGLSTGPHLHYEIRYNNEPIDPFLLYAESSKTINSDEYLNNLISLENI